MSDDVASQHEAAACGWQTGYGLPWDTYCQVERVPGQPYCADHMAALL